MLFRSTSIASTRVVISKGGTGGGSQSGWMFRIENGKMHALTKDGALNAISRVSSSTVNNSEWHFVTAVFTTDTAVTNNNDADIYIDGVLDNGAITKTSPPTFSNATVQIGRRPDGSYFNGTIDEVKIYNVSLSTEQILANYNEGLANHSVELIVSDETSKGDVWSVAVTPNDATEDGVTVLSNDLTISTGGLSVNLTSPLDNWYINDTPRFECSASSDVALANVTLYHNYSGSFIANGTFTTSATSYDAMFNRTGFSTEKTFIWNCYACDSEGTCAWGVANRTLTTDVTTPLIDFVSPTPDNDTRKSYGDNFAYVNVTVSDDSNNMSAFIDWNKSLVGWWRFEDNYNDSSSYGNNGNCSETLLCSNWTTGYRGKAPRFGGGYVNAGNDSSLNPRSELTVEAWIYQTDYSGNTYKRIVSKEHWDASNINDSYVLGLNSDSTQVKIAVYINETEYISQAFDYTIPLNEWVHVVGTYNGSNLSIYVNGDLRNSTSVTGLLDINTLPVEIGRESTYNYAYFVGLIDEVKIFSRALSQEEINASYQASIYKLYHNFTNLSSGNYTYQSHVVDQAGNLNQTEERTFSVNSPPTHSTPILNSSSGTNSTNDNLTCYNQSTADVDGDSVTNIYNWYKNDTSIAVLNMPFDSNNSAGSGKTRDYSSRGNNGTVTGATWNSSGKIGGAYNFDGVNDYIQMGSAGDNQQNTSFSFSVWYSRNIKDTVNADGIFGDWRWDSDGQLRNGWILRYFINTDDLGFILEYLNSTGGIKEKSVSCSASGLNQWYYASGSVDVSTGAMRLYLNGVQCGSTTITDITQLNGAYDYPLRMGYSPVNTGYFNGSIDEVKIYNYSLSPEQVWQNYIDSNFSYSNSWTIVSNETSNGDVWICEVTPNDATEDGTSLNSSSLTLGNTLPIVTLLLPEDNNLTTNRTPTFTWSGYDADGDTMTYEINITTYPTGSEDNRYVQGLSSETYTPSTDLKYLSDNNYWYTWKVRANDSEGYGAWSDERKINISALLMISLPVSAIDFGSISYLALNDTLDDSPLPLVIRNDGNCRVNVSVNASQLWSTVSGTSDKYRFKIDNKSGEEGAFDWLSSLTSWTNMSITSAVIGISGFNYSDSVDSAEVDISIEVPSNEPPAARSSLIVFTSSLDE